MGGEPRVPKSPGVGTRPRPKWWSQKRLTRTRGVRGFAGLVSQWAKARRRPEEGRSGFGEERSGRMGWERTSKTAGEISSRGWR